jgi:hypothetical protein
VPCLCVPLGAFIVEKLKTQKVMCSPGRCWSWLFEGEDDYTVTLTVFRDRLAGRWKIMKAQGDAYKLAWSYLELEDGPDLHIGAWNNWRCPGGSQPRILRVLKLENSPFIQSYLTFRGD